MIDDKTFMIGVGAQKAGTTWLYTYFRSHPDIFVPRIKELHYFDEVYTPGMGTRDTPKFARQLQKLESAGAVASLQRTGLISELRDRVAMKTDPTAYRRFFERRVKRRHVAFGEISPGYSLLPVEGLRDIRGQFPKAKVIFLLRDPVDRYYSQLRMREGRSAFDALGRFVAFLDNPNFRERTRYDLTHTRLLEVFGEENVIVEFYETLFTPECIGRICGFVGIPARPAAFDTTVKVSAPKKTLPQELEDMARARFAPVYDYCRDIFGSRVPATWLK